MKSTALHYAAGNPNAKYLELLIARPDIDPNIQDLEGNTPLIVAILHNNIEQITLLVNDPRVDTTIQNMFGKTAWDYTSETPGFFSVLRRHFSCYSCNVA